MKEFKQIELKEQELATITGGGTGDDLKYIIRYIREFIEYHRNPFRIY